MYNHHGHESKKQSYFNIRSVRNSLIPVLIASVLLAYLLIILSPVDKKALLIDMIKQRLLK
jgi:Zn-dependent membrane protease YugP